jgi:hypothetical protein
VPCYSFVFVCDAGDYGSAGTIQAQHRGGVACCYVGGHAVVAVQFAASCTLFQAAIRKNTFADATLVFNRHHNLRHSSLLVLNGQNQDINFSRKTGSLNGKRREVVMEVGGCVPDAGQSLPLKTRQQPESATPETKYTQRTPQGRTPQAARWQLYR